MARSGTVCLLGAGASADAGYPLATELRRQFVELVETEAKDDIESRREVAQQLAQIENSPNTLSVHLAEPDFDAPTIADFFNALWAIYEQCAASEKLLSVPKLKDGRPQRGSPVTKRGGLTTFPPYALPLESENPVPATLEGFFGFYDLLERPILRSLFAGLRLPEGIAVAGAIRRKEAARCRSVEDISRDATGRLGFAPTTHEPHEAVITATWDLSHRRCEARRSLC